MIVGFVVVIVVCELKFEASEILLGIYNWTQNKTKKILMSIIKFTK